MNKKNTAKSTESMVKHILETQQVASQQELLQLLSAEGHQVSQPMISRVLKNLHAQKQVSADGGRYYSFEQSSLQGTNSLHQLVKSVMHNEQLIVIKTYPGAAGAVAMLLDSGNIKGILATIAGDDVLLVVPAKIAESDDLKTQVEVFFSLN